MTWEDEGKDSTGNGAVPGAEPAADAEVRRDLSEAKETAIRGYFLQADLLVPKKSAVAFEAAVQKFLRAKGSPPFRPFIRLDPACNIQLVLALKSPKPFEYRERATSLPGYRKVSSGRLADKALMWRYVHMWLVPNLYAGDLARTMKLSADDALYIGIDRHVARETQNFVYQVQWPAAAVPSPLALRRQKDASGFVRSTWQYPSSDIGTFLFNLGAHFPALNARGCAAMGTYQNVTGALDTVTQFWQTMGRPGNALQTLGRALKRLPESLNRVNFQSGASIHSTSESSEAFMRTAYSP